MISCGPRGTGNQRQSWGALQPYGGALHVPEMSFQLVVEPQWEFCWWCWKAPHRPRSLGFLAAPWCVLLSMVAGTGQSRHALSRSKELPKRRYDWLGAYGKGDEKIRPMTQANKVPKSPEAQSSHVTNSLLGNT